MVRFGDVPIGAPSARGGAGPTIQRAASRPDGFRMPTPTGPSVGGVVQRVAAAPSGVIQRIGEDEKGEKGDKTPGFSPKSFFKGLALGPMGMFTGQGGGLYQYMKLMSGGDNRKDVQKIHRWSQLMNRFLIDNRKPIYNGSLKAYSLLPPKLQQKVWDQGSYASGNIIGSLIASFSLGQLLKKNPRTVGPYLFASTLGQFFTLYWNFTRTGRFIQQEGGRCADEVLKKIDRRDDDDRGPPPTTA